MLASAEKTIDNETKMRIKEGTPPDWDPKVIDNIVSDIKSDLVPVAKQALREVNEDFEAYTKYHNKVMRDPTENMLKNSLRSRKRGREVISRDGGKLDRTTDAIDEELKSIEHTISTDIKQSAEKNRYDGETRSYIRGLRDERRRREFLNSLFESGEKELIASILDAPHFLSGFEKPFSSNGYMKKFRETFYPEKVQKLESLGKVKSHINGVKQSLLEKIEGNEIYDHKSLDKAEALQA